MLDVISGLFKACCWLIYVLIALSLCAESLFGGLFILFAPVALKLLDFYLCLKKTEND